MTSPERPGSEPADLELVRRAQDGDRAAFGRLVERFKGKVHAMALAVAHDADEALDLTQETFARAYQGLPRLEDAARFPGWLRGITWVVASDVRRKAARERRHVQAAAQARGATASGAGALAAAADAASRDRAALVAALGTLSETARAALDLRYREGLSYAQIGEALGVPPSTVRGLLHRAMRALRQRLRAGEGAAAEGEG